jgi:hypothetical protein
MGRRPCTFRQSDVTRALKAALATGIGVAKIEIDKDGKIVIVTGVPPQCDNDDSGANEWDRI